MPRGSRAAYTQGQKRQAEHIEEGYEERGIGKEEAERRAWATVNKISGGGKKSGSGRGKKVNKAPMRTGVSVVRPLIHAVLAEDLQPRVARGRLHD